MDENQMYHEDTSRIGKSGLDLIAKCPAKYYAKYLDPRREREKQTKALLTGSALHSLVLETDKFVQEYVVAPSFSGQGATKKMDYWISEHYEKKIIDKETYDTIARMRDSLMKHPLVPELISEGEVEKRIDWTDLETGAHCKAKPDFRNTRNGLIVDLKSTEDASDEAFGRSAFKYRYHVQAPFYTDGMAANGIQPTGFVFIAVEKEPPYLVNVFFAEEETMSLGRRTYKRDLSTYMDCLMSGSWPGYPVEIKPLRLPAWTKNL